MPLPLTQLSVTRLSHALGAEVSGVDLSVPLDPDTVSAIHAAWLDHQVLLIRGQSLSSAQQIAFCRGFGAVQDQVSRFQGEMPSEDSAVLFVANTREDAILPEGEMWFHSDQCYCERPTSATCLYAIEVPPVGGNTRFADTYGAYESLDGAMKARLDGLRAVNVYDYWRNSCKRLEEAGAEAPRWSHPLVRTHPETGRKSLYICRLITETIEGMDRAESDELLETLFDHIESPAFIYEHRWRDGDVLIWDNRCTLHARTEFDPSHRRELRRIAVEGDIPV